MNKLYIAVLILQIGMMIILFSFLQKEDVQLDLWKKQVEIDKKFNGFIDYQKEFNKKVDDLVIVNLQ